MSWLWLIGLLGLAYGALAGMAAGMANSLMFHPSLASRVEPPGAIKLRLDDGTEVSALFLPNDRARFTLWFFHGNAEALGDIAPWLREYQRRGFSVFAVEYPGYGVSGGKPSEANVYRAGAAGVRYLRDVRRIPLERVIVCGRSLGGGAAVEIAANENVAGLVLESAFTSAYRVMTRWPILPGDKFKNRQKLAKVRCPVLVIHGRDDRVVPFHHGESLYAAVSGPKDHRWVDFAGHNDLHFWLGEMYWETLDRFVEERLADLPR